MEKAEVKTIELYGLSVDYKDIDLVELRERLDDYIKKGYTKAEVEIDRCPYYGDIDGICLNII